mmetsp:Transcript_31924/g.82717  ORF Transcript_31924/g.82717 Transcript_31924/m.82717 type:complete len:470 (-) Transcript_31924:1759-3168(-)
MGGHAPGSGGGRPPAPREPSRLQDPPWYGGSSRHPAPHRQHAVAGLPGALQSVGLPRHRIVQAVGEHLGLHLLADLGVLVGRAPFLWWRHLQVRNLGLQPKIFLCGFDPHPDMVEGLDRHLAVFRGQHLLIIVEVPVLLRDLRHPLDPEPRHAHLDSVLPAPDHHRIHLLGPVLLEEQISMQLHRRPPGPVRIPLLQVDGPALLLDPLLVREHRRHRPEPQAGRQQAVHQHVRVPADRGGEVGVPVDGQAVVGEVQGVALAGGEIHGLVHAPAHQRADQDVEVGVVRLGGLLQGLGELEVGAELEVLEPLLAQHGFELLEGVGLGRRVPAQDGEGGKDLGDVVRHGAVAQEHKLLDDLHHLHFLVLLHVRGVVGLAVHLELYLRRRQLQGPVGVARRSHLPRDDREPADALRELRLVVGVVVHGLRLVVGQRPGGTDECLAELHIHDLRRVGLHLPQAAETQPVPVAHE